MRPFTALLFLVLASVVGARASQEGDLASVQVLTGQAKVLTDKAVHQLWVSSPKHSIPKAGHIELGLRDHVRINVARSMSLTMRGFSSLGFSRLSAADRTPYAELLFFGSADIELRRGRLVLDLPQAWRLEVGRGSIHVRELVDGRIELVNRAGVPVKLISLKGGMRGVPSRLGCGKRLILPRA
jgi:hypothetical protein